MVHHNQEAVDRVLRFSTHCTMSKGKYANQPIRLMPWQLDHISKLFGTYNDDGSRLYRTAFLGLPRGQGKSTYAAVLATYMLFADAENCPEIVIASSSIKQSACIYDEVERMVLADPKLKARCKPVPSLKSIRLHRPVKKGELVRTMGSLRAITCQGVAAKQVHGLDLSGCFVDEVHLIDNKDYLDALRYSCSKNRKHSVLMWLTTAGQSKVSPCWSIWNWSKQVAGQDRRADPPKHDLRSQ